MSCSRACASSPAISHSAGTKLACSQLVRVGVRARARVGVGVGFGVGVGDRVRGRVRVRVGFWG